MPIYRVPTVASAAVAATVRDGRPTLVLPRDRDQSTSDVPQRQTSIYQRQVLIRTALSGAHTSAKAADPE